MLVDINLLPEKERERSTLLLAALAILGVAVLFWAVLFFISNAMEGRQPTWNVSKPLCRRSSRLSKICSPSPII